MTIKNLTESDIRARYITPAIEQAGWDAMTHIFHEFGLRAGRSNGVPRISTKQVGALFFGLPRLTEQSRIVARVNELRSLCADLRARILAGQAVQRNLANALVAADEGTL